ncbi:g5864 [Coccomyxa elongata]
MKAVAYLVKENTGGDAVTAQYAIRSHTWAESAADAMNSSTALYSLLGPGGSQTWDYVILQENSAYGKWTGEQERKSTQALLQLARLAKARSANVCLLLTWATLADTSATNFIPAQASLNDHYLRAAAAVKADMGLDAFIAPAGLAWQKIYDEMNMTAAGIPICTFLLDTNALQQFEAVHQSA